MYINTLLKFQANSHFRVLLQTYGSIINFTYINIYFSLFHQRLCEELEYSELLDSAASCPNGMERMALIAAFAVSCYAAAAHRAASKPFNPLLAETYECVRGDRGFRFIAEQVGG